MLNGQLSLLDTLYLIQFSNFSRVPGVTSTDGTTFTTTIWVPLMPLVLVIGAVIRLFTTTAIHLLPEITSVYMFTTLKPWGKWGPSSSFRDWVIICMLFPRSRVFVWPCIILDKKVSTSSFFVVLTTLFKSARSTVWFATVSLWIESPAHWQANNWAILDPFREKNNSLISLSLITLMILLMVGVLRVTGTQDPKPVESGKRLGPLDLCCSPKLLPPEPLWWHKPRARRILPWKHLYPGYHQTRCSRDQHPTNEPPWNLESMHWWLSHYP